MEAAVSPLPNTRAIPAGWAEHHRPVAAATMTAPCTIRRLTDGPAPYPLPDGWDGTEPVWSGTCRVQELKRENSPTPAGQPSELRQYLIGLPYLDDNPLPDLRTGERGDTVHAVGRVFNLKQSMAGSELWQHDFIAWENQTQQD